MTDGADRSGLWAPVTLVADEPGIAEAFADLPPDKGYRVTTACAGAATLLGSFRLAEVLDAIEQPLAP